MNPKDACVDLEVALPAETCAGSDLQKAKTIVPSSLVEVAVAASASQNQTFARCWFVRLAAEQLQLLCWAVTIVSAFFLAWFLLQDLHGACAMSCFVVVVSGWAFRPGNVAIEYVALLYMLLLPATGVLKFDQTWKHLASPGVMLIFSGMALSLGLTETSVAARLAEAIGAGGCGWRSLLLRLHIVGVLLAMAVPSQMVRVQLVMPIARRVLETRAIVPKSRQAAAIVLSLVISTNNSGAGALTGSVPNLIAVSSLQNCGLDMAWGNWFLRMAPTFGLGAGLVSFVIICNFSKDGPCWNASQADKTPRGSLDAHERWVIGLFCAALVLWSTDLIHGVHPTVVALAAVLLMFAPGALSFKKLQGGVNFSVLIFVAATMVTPANIAEVPKLNMAVQSVATDVVSLGKGPWCYVLLMLLACPVSWLCNAALSVGMLAPLLCEGQSLNALGLDPQLGAMALAGAGNISFLPFQVPPLLLTAALAKDILRLDHFVAMLSGNAILSLLVLTPCTILLWNLLGWST